MLITCIAIDDEPLALAMIREYCQRVPGLVLTGSFTDGIEAAQTLRLERPDLLLLDIQMPDISGLQIARNTDYSPQIIFTTAHSQFAVEGFELDAADYLLKPYSFERFLIAIDKVKKRLAISAIENESGASIVFKSTYQNIEVRCAEILYVEAMDNYATIYTEEKKYIAHSTLKSIEDQLPEHQFIRIHRSYIINRSKISSFTKSTAMIGAQSIPVGRSYSATFARTMQIDG